MMSNASHFLAESVSHHGWLMTVVILSWQCAILVAIAGLVARFGFLSSAWKHRLWGCVIVLAIFLVPASFCLPIEFVVKMTLTAPESIRSNAEVQMFSLATQPRATEPTASEVTVEPTNIDRITDRAVKLYVGPRSNSSAPLSATQSVEISPDLSSSAVPKFGKPFLRWDSVLICIYIGGALLLVLRLAAGWVRLILMSRCKTSLDAFSDEIACDLGTKLKLSKMPRFVVSAQVRAPMSWGILNPQVLLPESFNEWPQECRRAVLAHELSHIARRDSFIDLLACLVSAMYWFHPAIHFATRRLESTREEATDEHVMACGILPENYARQLIAVVQRCALPNTSFLPTAVSMTKKSTLESRIRRILARPSILADSRPISRRLVLCVGFLCLLFAAMPFRFVSGVPELVIESENPAEQPSQAVSDEPNSLTLFQRFQKAKAENKDTASEQFIVEGTVFGPNGEPVADSIVLSYLQSMDQDVTIADKTRTDAAGRYKLTCSRNAIQSDADGSNKRLQLVAVDSENRMGWSLVEWKAVATERPIRLAECVNQIEGIVLAPGGKPLAGIEVQAESFFRKAVLSAVAMTVNRQLMDFKTITDGAGRFALSGLPGEQAMLRLNAAEWEVLPSLVDNSQMPASLELHSKYGRVDILQNPVVLNSFPSVQLLVKVINSNEKAIAGARIEGNGISDADGHLTVRLPEIIAWEPNGDRQVKVKIEPPTGSSLLPTYLTVTSEKIAKREILTVVCEGEWISGKILSATTKQPLPNILVRTKPQSASKKEVLSDADGKFRILVKPGQIDLECLPAGLLWEEASQFLAEGSRRRAARQFDILAGEPVDVGAIMLNYPIREIEPVSVQVTMAGDKPAANCKLELFHLGDLRGSKRFQASLRDDEEAVASVKTDRNGFANLQPLLEWEQENMVFASYPASQPTHFGVFSLTIRTGEVVPLRLVEGAKVTGKVTLNGEPLRGAHVIASFPNPYLRDFMPPVQFESSETSADGLYAMDVIPDDSYKLDIKLEESNAIVTGVARVTRPKLGIENYVDEIALISGKEELIGKVVDEMGKPIPLVDVSFQFDSGSKILISARNSSTSSKGEFRLTGLPAGIYKLTASARINVEERQERMMARKQPDRLKQVEATAGQKNLIIVLPD